MKTTLTLLLSAGALTFGTSRICAVQIDGTIVFRSLQPISINSTDFTLATQVNFMPGPNAAVSSATSGDFATVFPGADNPTVYPATFKTFKTDGTPLSALWAAAGATFDLLTASNFSTDNTFLNIAGSGTLHVAGFDDTQGNFTFSATRSGGVAQTQFTFAASSTGTPTPDGGATAALLGVALLALLPGVRSKA